MAPIYESDPDRLPDARFEPGGLGHLVPGNRGRLLDARRTPVVLRAINLGHGTFQVELTAFEDAGARWDVPFEEVDRFQFARGGETLDPAAVRACEEAVHRLNRPLTIVPDPEARQETFRQLATERERVGAWLDQRLPAGPLDVEGMTARRTGDERLYLAIEELLAQRDLTEVERVFTTVFVSGPASAETVKGHAIVLAELGLAAYHGKVVRDPGLFDGPWSRERRRLHILTRLAFVHQLLTRDGLTSVTLYRGAAWDGGIPARKPSSFVSTTLSRSVAEAHFDGGPTTTAAALFRQLVPTERVFMTFLETRAMNQRFREAEATLIGDAGGGLF